MKKLTCTSTARLGSSPRQSGSLGNFGYPACLCSSDPLKQIVNDLIQRAFCLIDDTSVGVDLLHVGRIGLFAFPLLFPRQP